jgi:hypothetical protein
MAVIFPDIEPILVSHLQTELASYGYEDTYVATKKAQPDDPQETQVIITASYGQTNDFVLRNASAVIDVYADSYAGASELGLLVATIVLGVPGDDIKKAEVVLGPVRQADEAPQEKRSMSVDFVVKGSTL